MIPAGRANVEMLGFVGYEPFPIFLGRCGIELHGV
jgi:hypothetical protein